MLNAGIAEGKLFCLFCVVFVGFIHLCLCVHLLIFAVRFGIGFGKCDLAPNPTITNNKHCSQCLFGGKLRKAQLYAYVMWVTAKYEPGFSQFVSHRNGSTELFTTLFHKSSGYFSQCGCKTAMLNGVFKTRACKQRYSMKVRKINDSCV